MLREMALGTVPDRMRRWDWMVWVPVTESDPRHWMGTSIRRWTSSHREPDVSVTSLMRLSGHARAHKVADCSRRDGRGAEATQVGASAGPWTLRGRTVVIDVAGRRPCDDAGAGRTDHGSLFVQ